MLTLNAHKGLSPLNQRFVLPELRDAIRSVGADLVFLQEVLGSHDYYEARFPHRPSQSQYEFLADSIWHQYAYGRNAIYPGGDHGNALLSKFPIENHRNYDITIEPHEKRGLLYGRIKVLSTGAPLHAVCTHFGLRESQRRYQLTQLCRLLSELPPKEPVVVAGDFNDWNQRANRSLTHCAGMREVWSCGSYRPPRTFPARFPLLRLDRIYVRNLQVVQARVLSTKPWPHLSDHLPLAAELTLAPNPAAHQQTREDAIDHLEP